MKFVSLSCFALLFLTACSARGSIETGTVEWQRDFEQALVDAKASEKPIFLLFQEVPGCAGCKQFGKGVLSDPRLVKVIEREFIPVLVRNNVLGKEREILKRYNEPAWNFQVVRFLDSEGEDLIPRKDRVWDTVPLAKRMLAALEAAGRDVPMDLKTMIGVVPQQEAEIVFAQYCFWTAEARLGALEGVHTTEAGFYKGREVTRVRYDPSAWPTDTLIQKARDYDCADAVYLPHQFDQRYYRKAPESDQKKQLEGTPLASVKMSPEQATKVNAWVRRDWKKALSYLDDGQKSALE